MYSFKSRVRYSEVGKDKRLSLGALINYFQDCSTFHSESIGLGIEKLEQDGQVWVLSSWQIVVKDFPKLFEEIEVCTWPYGFKGFYGMRNFCLKNRQGEMVAWANSLWIFMDLKSGRPMKITEEQEKGYEPEERLDMDYAGRKLPMPKDGIPGEPIIVLKHQIDTNDHVNNGQYVEMAGNFLPEGFHIGQMRAEYKKSAKLGDVLIPYINEENGVYTVALCDEGQKPYAVVEFSPNENGQSGKDGKTC